MILKNINKKYGEKTIYENFNLEIEDGKITAILGASGCGKTTFLKIISGITDYGGQVKKDNPVSYVFQNDRLVKNLTVKENIELVCKGIDCEGIIEKVGLKKVENEYPKNLSGGMARRVAVIRGILYSSPLLLMDEPFINLDIKLKYSLMDIIKENNKERKRTVVFVTHDIDESLYMADRLIVINKGKVVFDKDRADCNKEELLGVMLK